MAAREERARLGAWAAAGVVLLACACGGPPSEPTHPESGLSALIPAAPAPSPSVSPTPPASDDTLPAGSGGEAAASSCGAPVPPAIGRVNVKVHSSQPERWVLDATPLVGPDAGYCAAIGFTDGRSFCPVRPEGHPEREACEALRVGVARDTGRVGPTWSVNGKSCTGGDVTPSCENHPSNQYLAYAFSQGTFRACVSGGGCGSVTLP